MYVCFFLFNLVYALFPVLFTTKIEVPVFLDLINQTQEWNSISQFGELVFLYYPHLLIVAALVLFIAIVSPVVLSFISYAGHSVGLNVVSHPLKVHKQNIFLQTLRLSVDKNFN